MTSESFLTALPKPVAGKASDLDLDQLGPNPYDNVNSSIAVAWSVPTMTVVLSKKSLERSQHSLLLGHI